MGYGAATDTSDDWRERFLQIKRDTLMADGDEGLDAEDDPSSAAELHIDVHGIDFQVMHFGSLAGQAQHAHCLVHGVIGPVQLPRDQRALRTALVVNQGLARTQSGQIALDATKAWLIYSVFQSLHGLDHRELRRALEHMADFIQQLRTMLDLQAR